MAQTLYVLKGDIEEYDYQVFGVFDSKEKLLQAAGDVIARDFAIAEQATEDYDFSGLVYYPLKPNEVSKCDDNKWNVYWDRDKVEVTLKKPVEN